MAIESNELSGKVLGTCTLQHLLGRGGMGVVYLARQSRPRRTVAVKVLVPGMHTDLKARAEFLVRFRREADAIAALDHINIMPIYEYGEQGEMAYLVMPFVTGGTLRTLLEKKNILSLSEVVPIVEQAAAALDAAHAQGIVHRDLKPGNILFHADGRVLLADFGLAKVVRGSEDSSSSDSLTTLTSVGTIIGTPEYLSPEQSTGQPIGPTTDIYALGIVLYQMLGGRVPFTAASPVSIALKHTMEAPPSLLQLNPTLPPQIETVVMKALAKVPEERFKSAGEFARALHTAAFGTPAPSGQLYANITTSNPDKPVLNNHITEDAINNTPTEESPRISHLKEKFPVRTPRLAKENPVNTRPDSISKLPTEEQPSITLAQEPLLPEYQAQAHRHPETSNLHTAETVAAPLPGATEASSPLFQPTTPPLAPLPTRQASPGLAPPPAKLPSRQVTQAQNFTDKPPATPRRGCQSASMMLLGSLVTLLLVVGGFIAYLNLTQKSNSTHTPYTTGPSQGTAKTTKAQPFTPPPAMIGVAGNAIYGTASPGPQCDSQNGQWSKQSGISLTCSSKDGWTQLTNTGGDMAGIFLSALPHGQNIPDNYVLQIEVNINSTHGQFGVFFRKQANPSMGADAFLLDPGSSRLIRNEYDDQTGAATITGNYQVGNLAETVTLDITVQGDDYKCYLNGGSSQAETQSARYSGGDLGLVAAAGTTVSFRNMVIYAL